jgi:hypothetical protein
MNAQFLDPIPVVGVFLAIVAISLVVYEVGYRLGRWWQRRTPDHKEGPTGMLVGSVLGLLAFLLAVTMSMASDRFDTRRALVLEETNSIGTTYLRAGFLDEPYAGDIRELLREYVPLRITVNDRTQYLANQEASIAILNQIWKQAEEVTRDHPESEAVSLFIETLNDTIDLQTTRATAVIIARVPDTILILLFLGEVLAMGIVGYSAGLTGSRGLVAAMMLILAFSAVLTLLVDLDRPRDGFLQVNQQPLITLSEQLGPP